MQIVFSNAFKAWLLRIINQSSLNRSFKAMKSFFGDEGEVKAMAGSFRQALRGSASNRGIGN
jgi:hypothetical protein